MKKLATVPRKGTLFATMEDSLAEEAWDQDTCVIQKAESTFEIRKSRHLDRADLHYRVLFLHIMRHLHKLAPEAVLIETKKADKEQRPTKDPDKPAFAQLANLASWLGFETDEILALNSMATNSVELVGDPITPVMVTNGPGETDERRRGRPFALAHENSKNALFFDNMHNVDRSQGSGITPFAVRKFVYLAFFGQPATSRFETTGTSAEQGLARTFGQSMHVDLGLAREPHERDNSVQQMHEDQPQTRSNLREESQAPVSLPSLVQNASAPSTMPTNSMVCRPNRVGRSILRPSQRRSFGLRPQRVSPGSINTDAPDRRSSIYRTPEILSILNSPLLRSPAILRASQYADEIQSVVATYMHSDPQTPAVPRAPMDGVDDAPYTTTRTSTHGNESEPYWGLAMRQDTSSPSDVSGGELESAEQQTDMAMRQDMFSPSDVSTGEIESTEQQTDVAMQPNVGSLLDISSDEDGSTGTQINMDEQQGVNLLPSVISNESGPGERQIDMEMQTGLNSMTNIVSDETRSEAQRMDTTVQQNMSSLPSVTSDSQQHSGSPPEVTPQVSLLSPFVELANEDRGVSIRGAKAQCGSIHHRLELLRRR